jgi:signal transduction histidine kinase
VRLSEFITSHLEPILMAWESFARTLGPGAHDMGKAQLRDHAKLMLEAIAIDLDTPQSGGQRDQKSKGLAPVAAGAKSAASVHGNLRGADGFTLLQLTAEFRALRASVLQLWSDEVGLLGAPEIADLFRFNEAIDQAIAESVVEYSARADRSRDTSLARRGHDLRGPLALMASAGDYLGQPAARWGDLPALGARVKRNALTMASMVNDLLEYARTQLGGAMPVKPEVWDLQAVAVDALRVANAAHPSCPFELEAQGNLVASFDAVRVQQVITNLLNNAAQYRDDKHRVTLSLSGDDAGLTIVEKNRGPVIPTSAFEAIFNPLVQLAQPIGQADRPETSMGLGLFIAKEIASAHGGSIAVTSTAEDGTIFTVTLPR